MFIFQGFWRIVCIEIFRGLSFSLEAYDVFEGPRRRWVKHQGLMFGSLEEVLLLR
jgi:hypothetical protein